MSLIYVPNKLGLVGCEWYNPSQCVWEGGWYLHRIPILKRYYPRLGGFLSIALQVGNESLATVLAELRQITPSDGLEYVSQLFKAVNGNMKRVHGTCSSVDFDAMAKSHIFPITAAAAESSGSFDRLLSGEQYHVWFIADRHYLHRSFEGVIPLLAFSVEDVGRMGPALSMLGVENRLLSKQVKEETWATGSGRLDTSYTRNLRRRARFLSRYKNSRFAAN